MLSNNILPHPNQFYTYSFLDVPFIFIHFKSYKSDKNLYFLFHTQIKRINYETEEVSFNI